VVGVEDNAGAGLVEDAASGVGVEVAAPQAFEMGAQAAQAVGGYAAHLLKEEDASACSGIGRRKAGCLEQGHDLLSQRLNGHTIAHVLILTGIEVR
jgi:hypothetical protein